MTGRHESKTRTFGTREWADYSVNVQVGCENACLYCYARAKITSTHRSMTTDRWSRPIINRAKVYQEYRLQLKPDGRHKRAMFPSSHDITEGNIRESITVLRKLLENGTEVLIVSKPRLECVKELCRELAGHRDQILYRFTIGSADNDVLRFWEPEASTYEERVEALELAQANAFATSVSCEPMLDGRIDRVIEDVRPFVGHSIWIGKINWLNKRLALNCNGVLLEEAKRRGAELLEMQGDENILALFERYKNDPLIRWKGSIKEVVGIELPTEPGLDI